MFWRDEVGGRLVAGAARSERELPVALLLQPVVDVVGPHVRPQAHEVRHGNLQQRADLVVARDVPDQIKLLLAHGVLAHEVHVLVLHAHLAPERFGALDRIVGLLGALVGLPDRDDLLARLVHVLLYRLAEVCVCVCHLPSLPSIVSLWSRRPQPPSSRSSSCRRKALRAKRPCSPA